MNLIKRNPFISSLIIAAALAVIGGLLLTIGLDIMGVISLVLAGLMFVAGPFAIGFDAE